MIHVIASITLKPGMKASYLKELWPVIPSIRAEQGCIEYGVVEDLLLGLPPQQESAPDTVVIIERWTDENALKTHLGAQHMVNLRKRVESIMGGVQLKVLQAVSKPV
ncbi:MAG: antibiotic biosynthesis monooxygenase [Spongiibacteraceae bacterium]|nr:antibiotic biosynthesis monooxygenase [Spongiibacteraceae bacterium]